MKFFASADALPKRLRKVLKEELRTDERVKWLAQPEHHEFQEDQFKIQIFGALFALLPVLMFWKELLKGLDLGPQVIGLYIGVGFFVLFGLHLVLIPFVARQRAKRILYVFTDKRALLFSLGAIYSKHVHSFEGRRLLKARIVKKRNGSGSINFAKYRIQSEDLGTIVENIGFSNIPNIESVMPILEEVKTNVRGAMACQ